MIWDKAAIFYDLFEDLYNGAVNRKLCDKVASCIKKEDRVLECACGTGMLSVGIAKNCDKLIATDYSVGMLKKTRDKCKGLSNVKIAKASITELHCKDCAFDKVVAANVIHLLDDPEKALNELVRVCRPGGKVIIPTYINDQNKKEAGPVIKLLEKIGIDFKKQFDLKSYQEFFENAGYYEAEYSVINGRMPCAIAVIEK